MTDRQFRLSGTELKESDMNTTIDENYGKQIKDKV
jgi:hypothetical protein